MNTGEKIAGNQLVSQDNPDRFHTKRGAKFRRLLNQAPLLFGKAALLI